MQSPTEENFLIEYNLSKWLFYSIFIALIVATTLGINTFAKK